MKNDSTLQASAEAPSPGVGSSVLLGRLERLLQNSKEDADTPGIIALEDAILAVKRLDMLVKQFEGIKWNDAGPLSWWKPEDEKYISREDLLNRLDSELA